MFKCLFHWAECEQKIHRRNIPTCTNHYINSTVAEGGDAELMTIINFKILHLALAAFALDFNNMHLVAFSHV